MYKNKNGVETLETFDEVLRTNILSAFADDRYYYIRPVPRFEYDGQAYKIDKQSNKVESIHVLDIGVAENKDRGLKTGDGSLS